MELRVIMDESHGELLSLGNSRGISYVFEKLKVAPFRLLSGPITIDKIVNDDVLFLGAPTQKFFDFEIKTIKYFVSRGKFLIVVCPVPIAFNLTLNDLVETFGMRFEHNIVQDKKHNLDDASYFPIIRHFTDDVITQELKELVYSGCSIKKLSHEIRILASTDEDAEPPSVPVIATTPDDRVICIGGSSLFSDDKRSGIKAKNNLRFVANLFRMIILRYNESVKEEKIVKEAEIIKPEKPEKVKSVDPKRAKKYFEKLTNDAIINLNKIAEDIDKLFSTISSLINSQLYSSAEETLKTRYLEFKKAIEGIYQEIMTKHEELSSRITQEISFATLVKETTDQLLVVESDTLSKLDMIRFNLSNQISKEKLRYS